MNGHDIHLMSDEPLSLPRTTGAQHDPSKAFELCNFYTLPDPGFYCLRRGEVDQIDGDGDVRLGDWKAVWVLVQN